MALSLKDGQTLWKYHTKAVQLKASAAVKDGIVVIGDGEGIIHALDVKPGQEAAFEAAFDQATSIISASPGFRSLELQRCLERPGR